MLQAIIVPASLLASCTSSESANLSIVVHDKPSIRLIPTNCLACMIMMGLDVTQSLIILSVHALALQVPLHVVIGMPLPTPQMDNPRDEDVQHHLNLYITAMERLCEKYKHETGHADMQFQIV